MAEKDKEAYEVIAFAKSYAGKIEEKKDEEESRNRGDTLDEEEKKVREDKKVSFSDRDPALDEVIPIRAQAPVIDEANNQAGPSSLSMPSTPRPTAQKNLQSEGSPEPDAKKFKPTVEKTVHGIENQKGETRQ